MRMLLAFRPASPLAASLCVAAILGLSACASKNPLMEEPAPVATAKPAAPVAPAAPASATKPAPAPTAAAVPAAPVASAKIETPANKGVETSKERRLFGIFTPYRPDIQQGNFVSREMMAQLKIGMTPEQVRFVLGTPLLTDIFHADRWDYVFRLEKRNGDVISSRIGVFFKDNRLARIDAGELPTEKEYISLIAGTPPAPAATPTAAPAADKK